MILPLNKKKIISFGKGFIKIITSLLLFGILGTAILSCKKLDEMAAYFNERKKKSQIQSLEDLEDEAKDLQNKLRSCVTDSNRLGVFYRLIGQKHAKQGNFIQAIKFYKLAIEQGEEKPNVLHDLGALYANRARFEKSAENANTARELAQSALIYYNKALLKDPRRISSKYGKALLLYYVMDRKGEALQILEGIKKEYPKEKMVLFALGRIYFEENNLQKAISIYQSVLEIVPANSDDAKKAELNIKQCFIRLKQKP